MTKSGAGIMTYRIFHNRKSKNIPKIILKSYEKKYKYVYHNAKDDRHRICNYD